MDCPEYRGKRDAVGVRKGPLFVEDYDQLMCLSRIINDLLAIPG